MNRNEFLGDKKLERIKDPEIKPKQRWRAIRQHDFGNGLVDYFIDIAFTDPMSNLWTCNYAWINNLIPHTSSLYVAKLTAEEITKNFEISIAAQPETTFSPIYIPNNPIPRQFPAQQNGFFNNTIGTTNLIPNGVAEVTSNFEASLTPEFLAFQNFNFPNHIEQSPSL